VDLPGFGYAKLDKQTKASVQETAEHYLENRKELALGVLLVDSRRVPTPDDKAVLAALFDMGLPLVVVATKVDKLSSQRQVDDALNVINHELGLPENQPLCISSVTGQGIKELWKIILEACEGRVEELRIEVEQGGHEDSEDVKLALSEMQDQYLEDEDSEIVYSQGYDWVHGSVLYEAEAGEEELYYHNEGGDEDDGMDDYYDDSSITNDEPVPQRQSIKFLRKLARDMERRGEF
jgi:GTP-binding protein